MPRHHFRPLPPSSDLSLLSRPTLFEGCLTFTGRSSVISRKRQLRVELVGKQVRLQNAHYGRQQGAYDGRDQRLEGGDFNKKQFKDRKKNPSYLQANTEKPKWDEEELETRTSVMSLVKLHDCQLENCHVARLYFLFCCHVAMFPTCTSTFVAELPCFLLYLFLLPGGGKGRVYRGGTKETDHCGHERPCCWR